MRGRLEGGGAGWPQALQLGLVLQHNKTTTTTVPPGMRDRSSQPVQNNRKESQVSRVTMLTCNRSPCTDHETAQLGKGACSHA